MDLAHTRDFVDGKATTLLVAFSLVHENDENRLGTELVAGLENLHASMDHYLQNELEAGLSESRNKTVFSDSCTS